MKSSDPIICTNFHQLGTTVRYDYAQFVVDWEIGHRRRGIFNDVLKEII